MFYPVIEDFDANGLIERIKIQIASFATFLDLRIVDILVARLFSCSSFNPRPLAVILASFKKRSI